MDSVILPAGNCQSTLDIHEANTLDECLRLVPEAERGDFKNQLRL